MADIRKEDGTYFICDLSEFFEVDLSCIGRGTAYDDLRLNDLGNIHDPVIVDTAVKFYTIGETLIIFP